MGYSINLIDERRSIQEEDAQHIFESLPIIYRGATYSKQGWGWSTAVDVSLKTQNKGHLYLVISGSYSVSGTLAALATIHWQQELYKLGYTNIVIISDDFQFNSKTDIGAFPRVKNILPEEFQIMLRHTQESGMGYHRISIKLNSGILLGDITVYNCSEYWYEKEINSNRVVDITMLDR